MFKGIAISSYEQFKLIQPTNSNTDEDGKSIEDAIKKADPKQNTNCQGEQIAVNLRKTTKNSFFKK